LASIGITAALKCCAIELQNGVERTAAIVLSCDPGEGDGDGDEAAGAASATRSVAAIRLFV
jgi:hypothetical protein